MLSSPHPAPTSAVITSDDKLFFKELGSRIAQLRKDAGLSQQVVADQLGIAQQTLAHYEVGRLRVPASLLPRLAQLFNVRGDDLLGLNTARAGKRGPTPLLQKQIEQIAQLPKAKQRFVMQMLETVLAQASR